jgi:plastocyanin
MDDFIYGEPQPISELSESSAPVTAGAETIDIAIADNSFTPPTITVPVGTTLVWTHGGQRQHTVTAENGDFNSGTLEQNATFQHTFDQPGVYPYFCEIHGGAGGAGMSAVITVGEG